MSLLPDSASFEERVQDCFLAYRGAGLMLSPLDQALLAEWADRHIPFEVVARGIRKAAERALFDARPGEPALRTLRACRKQVEAEIRKHADRAVGGREAPGGPAGANGRKQPPRSLEEERRHRMRKTLKALVKERPALAEAVSRFCERLLEVPWEDASALEARVEAGLLRALPYDERRPLLLEAARHAKEAGGLSARARLLSRRFHRGALVRRALCLPSFW